MAITKEHMYANFAMEAYNQSTIQVFYSSAAILERQPSELMNSFQWVFNPWVSTRWHMSGMARPSFPTGGRILMPGFVPAAEDLLGVSRRAPPWLWSKSGQTAGALLETHHAKGRPVRPHWRGQTRTMEERANSQGSNKAHGKIRASIPGAGRQASIGEEKGTWVVRDSYLRVEESL